MLPPPQLYETSKLIHFKSIDGFKDYSFKRQLKGTERWLPFKFSFQDAIMFVYPGDFRYPQRLDLVSPDYLSELEGNVDDDLKAGSLNRTVIKKGVARVICNINLKCGHLRPMPIIA